MDHKTEVKMLLTYVEEALETILLSRDRTSKHPALSWLDEHEDEHLRKASRHILTHQLVRDGQQPETQEDHLYNAVCRLAMAMGVREQHKELEAEFGSPFLTQLPVKLP